MRITVFLWIAALLVSLSACSRERADSGSKQQDAQSLPKIAVDAATAAGISGTVHFSGTPQKPRGIDMTQDPSCKGENEAESLRVQDGRLANVYVYVEDGLQAGQYEGPRTNEVVVDQKGCRYVPHVIAVTTGQPVRILNSDDTTHNVHPMPQNNREWNQSQTPGAEPVVKRFSNPETMIPVKCNNHPWMSMFVNVASHPFFAVTGTDGKFRIAGLPPGTYTLAAVHEKLGERTLTLTLGPKENKQADFTFDTHVSAASTVK